MLLLDRMVEEEVVSIEPGRVIATPDHREQLAVAHRIEEAVRQMEDGSRAR